MNEHWDPDKTVVLDEAVPEQDHTAFADDTDPAGDGENPDDPDKKKRKKKIVSIIAAAAVVAGIGVGALIATQGAGMQAINQVDHNLEKAITKSVEGAVRAGGEAESQPDEGEEPENETSAASEPSEEGAANTSSGGVTAPPASSSGNGGSTSAAPAPAAALSNAGSGSYAPSAGNSGDGGSTNAAPTPSTPAAPSHTHNWVEQTTQQWVPNNVWVVDQAAWDETVPGRTYVLCTCDRTFDSNAAWSSHNESAMLQGDMSHRSSVRTDPPTIIHHDEVGHTEDRGYYQTVVTGYRCSCGATK